MINVKGEQGKSNANAPSGLVAYGLGNVRSISESGLCGKLVILNKLFSWIG